VSTTAFWPVAVTTLVASRAVPGKAVNSFASTQVSAAGLPQRNSQNASRSAWPSVPYSGGETAADCRRHWASGGIRNSAAPFRRTLRTRASFLLLLLVGGLLLEAGEVAGRPSISMTRLWPSTAMPRRRAAVLVPARRAGLPGRDDRAAQETDRDQAIPHRHYSLEWAA